MREWDPIGVAEFPEARDEYDSYLGRIADRLRVGDDAAKIADLLGSISTDWMGLDPNRAHDLHAATAVRRWYDAEMASR
jgi:hypothetical protein